MNFIHNFNPMFWFCSSSGLKKIPMFCSVLCSGPKIIFVFCSMFCRTEKNTTVLEHVFCVLSSLDLAKFNCRRTDTWQLPQYCGTNCRESDKTYHSCESSLIVDPGNENFLIFESVGIPDHNACAKPPKTGLQININ